MSCLLALVGSPPSVSESVASDPRVSVTQSGATLTITGVRAGTATIALRASTTNTSITRNATITVS